LLFVEVFVGNRPLESGSSTLPPDSVPGSSARDVVTVADAVAFIAATRATQAQR
jgi:hypothetical protein